MESSQLFGGAEECHSSESGWTMYLGSSIHGGADDNQYSYNDQETGHHGGHINGKHYYYQEDDSDDSMASDASSGPSHQGIVQFKNEQEKDDDEEDGKYYSKSKLKKHVEKQKKTWRHSEKREDVGFMEKRVTNVKNNNTTPATQSGSKVRTSTSWMGKRK